ncbi:MAG: hypothetical protein OXB94_04045 [Nitrospira sp.]|nr:hypothetical protein [Nitrospira sp.]
MTVFSRNVRSHLMPARVVWALLPLLILSLAACSSSRESFLKGALKNATQEEVVAQLGDPWKKKNSLLRGQATWVYRYALTPAELDPMGVDQLGRSVFQATESVTAMMGLGGGSNNPLNPGTRPSCFHYVLTFDDTTKILQRWAREACADTDL